ncbi:hypothetical protein HN283_13790 [Acinetobacter baumannii]|uniref:hypothetical protein n=1 Tax=Acinetobacter baumannii TaxID=470 RepID=UPI00135FD38E|nr:hypothetical protein [Acinetobacter baumannii]MBF6813595.1 hypothetical protein [Acinetobacter baumannii]MBF6914147.1 hypothetical protein [Acinetobacter baumannii]MBF6974596.1 hypothetical protein [Acinetobacter baumannii]MCJ9258816.1 hypothetical protein [Acinetobacter baumannii]MDC4426091.1 hypothetical protein [Acinetobacter baumannii]
MPYLVKWIEKGTQRCGEKTVDTLQQAREYLEDETYAEGLIKIVLEEGFYSGTYDEVSITKVGPIMKLWQALKQADYGTVGSETIKWSKNLLGPSPETEIRLIQLIDGDGHNWAIVDQFQTVELSEDRTVVKFLDDSNASHDMKLFANRPVTLEEPKIPTWQFKASAIVQIKAETQAEAARLYSEHFFTPDELDFEMKVFDVQLEPYTG